ncbi:AMBP [Branchiostoma lanceolatum]|uniref:AMBP protein n=1 Tax=Branchiostoma lanceolatum TaxID=7740 RepID=A0A8J9ZEA3_BRALA|nr:AMBP [Branchiostoma lanceolatum]
MKKSAVVVFVVCNLALGSALLEGFCSLPKESGPCENFKQAFYFDIQKQKCVGFPYGGCGGNSNRFNTWAECMERCGMPARELAEATDTHAHTGHVCHEVFCMEECPGNLYASDENGCQTCGCACPQLKCLPCPNQMYMQDQYGCNTCQCECSELNCNDACPGGMYAKDEFGCDICQCLTPCPLRECPKCPAGHTREILKDGEGCEYCTTNCLPVLDCPALTCIAPCEEGERSIDASGCPTCDCVVVMHGAANVQEHYVG